MRQSFWLRQGLSLWESWQTRKGLTERARLRTGSLRQFYKVHRIR